MDGLGDVAGVGVAGDDHEGIVAAVDERGDVLEVFQANLSRDTFVMLDVGFFEWDVKSFRRDLIGDGREMVRHRSGGVFGGRFGRGALAVGGIGAQNGFGRVFMYKSRCIHFGVLLRLVDREHGVEGGAELSVQGNLTQGRRGYDWGEI